MAPLTTSRRGWHRLSMLVPQGTGLSDEEFRARHGLLRFILAMHIPAFAVFGLALGEERGHLVLDLIPILIALAAERVRRNQAWQAFWVTAGLGWCSTTLVHLSGGQIEAHFHFFIVVGLIALYQRWLPFAWAIAFTVISHGVGSAIEPALMFNHPAAIARPWLWACIHGGAVMMAAIAQVVFWAAAERERQQFESVVSNAFDGVAILREGTIADWVSPAMTRMSGLVSGDDVLDAIAPGHRDRAERGLIALRAGVASRSLFLETATTPPRWLEVAGVDLTHHRTVRGVVINVRDVTERRSAEQSLTWQATHDALTGLPNRSFANELIERAVADRSSDGAADERNIALMFIDVDGFKDVNDRHGHAAGDVLLRAIAKRLEEAVRSTDTVARLGGDEFVVLCPGFDDDRDLLHLADRVAETVSARVDIGGVWVSATVSVGIAVHVDDMTADELLSYADTAMYSAKSNGRDRVELFDPSIHIPADDDLPSRLRLAIDRKELLVHFQPIVTIPTRAPVGLEALVRWQQADGTLVSPAEFIPCAEEHGHIHDLGLLVLRQSCAGLLEWDPDGDTFVSVNVSVRQLQRRSFASIVTAVLSECGLPAERLMIEVTESVVIENDLVVQANLEQLAGVGIRLAMDDFGTGYSSLTNLKRFAFSVVKVDRDFVSGLHERSADRAIVEAVVGMAHALAMRVIAEGIENDEQMALLADIGSDLGQGFALGRPVPLDALAAPRSAAETAAS